MVVWLKPHFFNSTGLSNQQALNKLISDISCLLRLSTTPATTAESTKDDCGNEFPGIGINWKRGFNLQFLVKTFGVNNETSLFPWTAFLANLLHVIALAFCGGILTQVSYYYFAGHNLDDMNENFLFSILLLKCPLMNIGHHSILGYYLQ